MNRGLLQVWGTLSERAMWHEHMEEMRGSGCGGEKMHDPEGSEQSVVTCGPKT